MERLGDIAADGRVVYDVADRSRDQIKEYLEQTEIRLGVDGAGPLMVQVTSSPATSQEDTVLHVQPRYGDGTLEVADCPTVGSRDGSFPLDGTTAYVDPFNGTDYHVIIDSDPVEQLLSP